jgi:dTMP kinase
VRAINDFATGGLTPDLTLLLTIDPAVGRQRSQGREGAPDRLEREEDDFFARIAAAYADLARSAPERVVTIDAAQPPAAVLDAAQAAIDRALALPASQSG